MIVLYAEKEDMGIRYAAALGGINYNGKTITTENLSSYADEIKKNLARQKGYLETEYKGKKYIVTWGWGHFGTLKDIKDYNPEYDKWHKIPLPFIPKKYESKRIVSSVERFRKRDDRQFSLLTKIFNSDKCEYIINATDWEREGELIFAYVYDLTGTKKPYFRLRNTAKTDKEIRKAMDNLVGEKENYPFVLAARARSIADWCIGVNMTIAGTLFLSKDRSLLNIGRVMTPTLNLIVEREHQIRNFRETTSYGIEAAFGPGFAGRMEGDLFPTEKEAKNFIKDLADEGTIVSIETKTERKKPPLLHNTNTLQIEANEKYGFTLEQTLNTAQKLYEKGYLTYPRVDSQYLTEDKKDEIPKLISMLTSKPPYAEFAGPVKMPDRYFDNTKIDGHDAIIITDIIPKDLSGDEEKIYDLVARRMLMAVARDVVMEKTTVKTEVSAGDEKVIFRSTGTVFKDKGWGEITERKMEDSPLPELKKNQKVAAEYSVFEQTTKAPQRYTDASLIKAMENCGRKMDDAEAREYLKRSKGIGRPATRAALVERLIKAGYIERKKKQLVPTDKGMSTIAAITIDEIKSPILTAEWERSLDVIEHSDPAESISELRKFITSIHQTAEKWCKEMQEHKVESSGGGSDIGARCPVCGMPLAEGRDNFYCSGYKEGCKFSVKKTIAGKTVTKAMVKTLVSKGETSKLRGFKSSKGKAFEAKLKLAPAFTCPDCGMLQPEGKCYKCGKTLIPANGKIVTFAFDNKK